MSLASEALFDGEPCAHAVAYYEHLRIRRIERQRVRQVAVRHYPIGAAA